MARDGASTATPRRTRIDGGLLVCGSANLDLRRSFLCDSEIACAVADEAVVAAHQQQLWTLLFRDVTSAAGQWPGLSLNALGSGAAFFTAFKAAAADPLSYLRIDPWEAATPTLPNGVVLPRGSVLADLAIDHLFDPTSVDPSLIEGQVDFRDSNGLLKTRPPRLDEVVSRLEHTVPDGADRAMPNRAQSSEVRLPLIEVDPNFGDFAL